MKILILSFITLILVGIIAQADEAKEKTNANQKAEEEVKDFSSEAKAFLDCDHSVPGATCPSKMASKACLTCDTAFKVSPVDSSASDTTK